MLPHPRSCSSQKGPLGDGKGEASEEGLGGHLPQTDSYCVTAPLNSGIQRQKTFSASQGAQGQPGLHESLSLTRENTKDTAQVQYRRKHPFEMQAPTAEGRN